MGVSDLNLSLASVASWFVRRSISQRRTAMFELLVRAEIERARHELRLQNLGRSEHLIGNVIRRLAGAEARQREPEPVDDVLRAVAYSVLAYGVRACRRKDRADGLFTQAVELFERDGSARTPRDSADFGIALAAIGRDKEAVPHLKLALVTDSAPPEAAGVLAGLLAEKHPARARALVTEALEVLPGDPDLRLLQANLQRREKDDRAAESYLQAARLLLLADRATEALAAVDEARGLEPDRHLLDGLTGRIYEGMGEHARAFDVYSAGLAAVPGDVRLRVRRAATAARLGDVATANRDLEQALAAAGTDAKILAQAAIVALELGNAEGAATMVEMARSLGPEADAAAAVAEAAAGVRAEGGDLTGALDDIRVSCREAPPRIHRLRRYADLAGRAGETAEQIEVLERIRALSNADTADFLRLATALERDGRDSAARAVVEEAATNWPQDDDVSAARDRLAEPARPGRELARLTPPDRQQELFRLLSLNTRTAQARSLAEAGRRAEAEAELAGVLTVDPGYVPARELRVDLSLLAGDLDTAVGFARDLAADVRTVGTAMLLARVLLRAGRPAEALDVLDGTPGQPRAVEPAGAGRADLLSLRSDVLIAGYRYADAEALLAELTTLDPARVDAWVRRARVARHRGDSAGARSHAARAARLDPTDRAARRELAACALYTDSAGAAGLLHTLRTDPGAGPADDPDTELVYADLVGVAQPDLAVTVLRDAAARHPRRMDLFAAQARAVLHARGGQAALDLLADPRVDGDAAALCVRSEALRAVRRSQDAAEVAHRCLDLAPGYPPALAALGLALLDLGDGSRAERVLRRATEVSPNDPLALARLGHALAFLNQLEESLDLLDRAAVAAPGQPWVLAQLADVLSGAGHFSSAATLYRRVWEQQSGDRSDHPDPVTLNGLARCLQHLDPPALHEAVQVGRTAVDAAPDDLWSKENLANTYHRTGLAAEARALYGQVRDAARHRRTEDARYIGLASWCSFRLGELTVAARGLYEIVSATRTPTNNHFALALVHLCDGRLRRGADIYEQAMLQADHGDREWRRGLLAQARSDLRQAVEDYPALRNRAEVRQVISLIDGALAGLPKRAVRALTVLDSAS